MIIALLAAAAVTLPAPHHHKRPAPPTPQFNVYDTGTSLGSFSGALSNNDLSFSVVGAGTVITFTHEGRIVPGPGLSNEAATQGLFSFIAARFPSYLDAWARANGYVSVKDIPRPATPGTELPAIGYKCGCNWCTDSTMTLVACAPIPLPLRPPENH